MPRQSPEARSAAVWREGGKHPGPPKDFSADEKAVWREIVGSRPIDFFRPGALHLLEQLCVMLVAGRKMAVVIRELPENTEAMKAYLSYAGQCAVHCQKLRLSIQTEVDRKSGQLDEKEPSVKGRKDKADVLFGGSNVVKF